MTPWAQRFLLRLQALFRRERIARQLDDEIRFHLEQGIAENIAAGMSEEVARHTALRTFGNPTLLKESTLDGWGWAWVELLLRDFRYGARALLRSRGFSTVAILTLALGIGANTTIFSLINTLLLRPLPFSASDQLVRIYSTKIAVASDDDLDGPSPLDARDFAQQSHSFERVVAYDTWRKNVSFVNSGREPEQMRVGLVPAAYFETLDVQPILGRLFTEEENQVGKNYVAAISNRLWKSRFAGDPGILGRQIRINDEPYTIVAVMPDVIPDWMEPAVVEVWTPFAFADVWSETSRGERGYLAIGRMKPGVSLGQAQADLTMIASRLAGEHPVDEGIGVVLKRLADTRVGKLRPMLFLLMAAVGLILLIACVNLANLLMARNSSRRRELAVRAALGSGRRGLVRQLLAETSLLALAGTAAGLVLTEIGLVTLTRIHPEDLRQLGAIGMDWRVLTFSLSLSLLTTLLFGLAPALGGARLNLTDALKEGGRSDTPGRPAQRLRYILIVTEMAMSLMLLVGASLLMQSILRLQQQSLGIRQENLLKGHFYVPGARYPNPGAITRFCDAFAGRVRALPGVIDASVTTLYPPNDGWIQMLGLPGHPVTRIQDIPRAQFGVADAHFLATLGIPLIRGRDFALTDREASAPVALINQAFERRYFPAQDAIGRQIHIGPPPFLRLPPGADISDSADVTIAGVIGDFRNAGLALPPEPQIVVLYAQHPLVNYGFKEIVVRTASEPHAMAAAIRGQLRELDADMPFAEVQTIDELVEQETSEQRLTTVLLGLFAAAGLLLAIVGIYGVISFFVVQRNQELAVRLALGASQANVIWLVLQQALVMAGIGAALGLFGAWAAQKLTAGLLFDISPVDPPTFLGAAVVLMAVAAVASAIPAARVLRIDPARTLRQD